MNAWMVRPKPHGIPRMKEFLEEGIIAIGWPRIGDLKGLTKPAIKHRVSAIYTYTEAELSQNVATIELFINEIAEGDFVIAPDGDDIHLCKVTSHYYYDETKQDESLGYPQQRKVEWITCVDRNTLPIELRNTLKAPKTAVSLTKHLPAIRAIVQGDLIPTPTTDANTFTKAIFPVRPDVSITVEVPSDLTKQEAERLGDFFRALYFR